MQIQPFFSREVREEHLDFADRVGLMRMRVRKRKMMRMSKRNERKTIQPMKTSLRMRHLYHRVKTQGEVPKLRF
jgi:hypothetical protein